MKQRLTSLLIAIAAGFGLLSAAPALAHVLATDGQIGAVLHIDPADDPAAGQPSSLILEFKDKQNAFSLATCDCVMQVYREGKLVTSIGLTPAGDNPTVGFTSYSFPSKAVYELRMVGKPQPGTNFQPFSLQYSVRVARLGAPTSTSNTRLWIVVGLLVVVAVAAAVAVRGRRRVTPRAQQTTKDDDSEVF